MGERLRKEIKEMTDKATGWGDRVESFTKRIVEICERYGEFLDCDPVEVFKALEKRRDYSYPNFYQDANFPKLDGVTVYDTVTDLMESIDKERGFRCPSCKGVSKDPYACDTRIKRESGKECDWKAYGLFGTMGAGLRFTIKKGFLEKPIVDEIFMPVCMEDNQ